MCFPDRRSIRGGAEKLDRDRRRLEGWLSGWFNRASKLAIASVTVHSNRPPTRTGTNWWVLYEGTSGGQHSSHSSSE